MRTETRTRRASAMPPEERRDSIVAATVPLLLTHGSEVTSRQIAEAAGIAEGTIFRVFPDKDAVIVAALESVLDAEPLEAEFAAIDPGLPLEQRLAEVVEVLRNRILVVWGVLSALGPRHQQDHRPVPESPALTALLEPDAARFRLPVAVVARRLRAITLALTHPHLVPEPVEVAEIVDTVLHGVEVPSC